MKKLVTFLLIISMFFGTMTVKAMSESSLLEKITKSYDINGYTFSISEGDKALAKKYLDTYEVSEKDADYISGKIDEAISEMRKSGVKDFSNFGKLPAALKSKLKQLVVDVASNTSVKATVSKGTVVIYTPDGEVFAEVTKLVKDTGTNIDIIATLALLITAAGSVLIIKNVKANA